MSSARVGGATGFSRREWFTLSVLGSVHFSSAICVSLQAPFYPHEAEVKGATASEYGLVFGVFELVAFISCPIFGKYIDKMGAKRTMNVGVFVAGLSSMLFGLLHLIDSHTWFITLSFLVRIVESLGASAAVTATFSVTAVVFPKSVATTFATLEVCYGLGYIVGPTIGGYLFQLGGFVCPFLVMGSILLLDGLFILLALPPVDDDMNRPQAQIWPVLRIPAVFLDAFSVTAVAISVGYLSATLEPHVREFNLSPVATGSMFVMNGGVYAITAPLVGRICDSRVYPKKMIIFGCVLVIFSFTLVGPLPFIPLNTTLWIICVGLLIHGLGYACILVPAFIDAIRSSVAYGLPDDITTYGIVSGIWASSFALGAFVGPSVAGLLFDTVGFRNGTLFVIAVVIIVFIAMTTFVCIEKRQRTMKFMGNSSSSEEISCVHLCASYSGSSEEEPHCSKNFDNYRRSSGFNCITVNSYGSLKDDFNDMKKDYNSA